MLESRKLKKKLDKNTRFPSISGLWWNKTMKVCLKEIRLNSIAERKLMKELKELSFQVFHFDHSRNVNHILYNEAYNPVHKSLVVSKELTYIKFGLIFIKSLDFVSFKPIVERNIIFYFTWFKRLSQISQIIQTMDQYGIFPSLFNFEHIKCLIDNQLQSTPSEMNGENTIQVYSEITVNKR